jgi:hypothetical protein
MNMRAIGLATLCLIAMPVLALAQTDEIQVYDGEIAPPGIFNLMIHIMARRSTASRFARPNAHDHKFFYAANFEFSVNHSYWEPRTTWRIAWQLSTTKNILDALEANWQAEMEGFHTYAALSNSEADPHRRNALRGLAMAEKHHADLWAERIKELGGTEPQFGGNPNHWNRTW